MNKYFLKIVLLLLIFNSIYCQNKSGNTGKYEKLANMNWLLGRWENKMNEYHLSETWEKKNDSTFVGQGYLIKGKDTLNSERIQLLQKGDVLFYVPTVEGENDDKPIPFKLTTATEKEFTFENPKHDYPQKIVYKMINAANHIATISGIQQGKPSTENYTMKKIH